MLFSSPGIAGYIFMLSVLLKEQTAESHQALEKLLVGKLKAIVSLSDYTKLLKWFHSFYAPLEVQLSNHINDEILPDYHLRRKSDALIQDIEAVSGEKYTPDYKSTSVSLNSPHEALGALYVLEGSTLGGQIISKMIKASLGLSDNSFVSFFNGYGPDTVSKWQSFKHTLDNYPLTKEQELLAIKSANETFINFKQCLLPNEY